MAYSVSSPRNSFVQFGGSSVIQSCNFADLSLCLPVLDEDDAWFQFIVAGSEEEIDTLCDIENELITLSIIDGCDGGTLKTFTEKPDRYRISSTQMLYNWQHGFPGFASVVTVGQCFNVLVEIQGLYGTVTGCSNCFQRIAVGCHTSVIEYGNDDNAFGFNYCNSEGEAGNAGDPCEPTFIEFTDIPTLTVPYTASMAAQYGAVPTIKVWIYDENGVLVNMSVRQAFDTYPPTQIMFDFGGNATGVIKIS
jgi:hypothetical protein